METRKRDTTQETDPQYDWRDAETKGRLFLMAHQDDPDDDDDDTDDDTDDEAGDWGHVDPAEGNSPFPDSNDPSGPGSAV